jgi:hypothetical protein
MQEPELTSDELIALLKEMHDADPITATLLRRRQRAAAAAAPAESSTSTSRRYCPFSREG